MILGKKHRRGYTLMELVVAILCLAMLAFWCFVAFHAVKILVHYANSLG